MIDIKHKEDCCGCTACMNICPTSAITMQPDQLGFLYPKVDQDKCINCHLCENVCQFTKTRLKTSLPESYAVRHKNIDEVSKSRSGAAFCAFSDWILEHGGIVYGASFSNDFTVIHTKAETKEERDNFRGSKYVQSDLKNIFQDIYSELKKEQRLILFSGTPCQIAGLKSYLSIKKVSLEKLYLIDIVCHGVPSPFIWKDYLKYIEKTKKQKIIAVNFRDKSELGWSAHKESYTFTTGEKIYKDMYTYLFYEHIMFRHSCGKCPYADIYRESDITLADFWGWENTDITLNSDDKGISLILLNTEKGKTLFENNKSQLIVKKTILKNCMQPNLISPSIHNKKREDFEKDYVQHGLRYIMRKYGNNNLHYYLKTFHRKFKTLMRLIKAI